MKFLLFQQLKSFSKIAQLKTDNNKQNINIIILSNKSIEASKIGFKGQKKQSELIGYILNPEVKVERHHLIDLNDKTLEILSFRWYQWKNNDIYCKVWLTEREDL